MNRIYQSFNNNLTIIVMIITVLVVLNSLYNIFNKKCLIEGATFQGIDTEALQNVASMLGDEDGTVRVRNIVLTGNLTVAGNSDVAGNSNVTNLIATDIKSPTVSTYNMNIADTGETKINTLKTDTNSRLQLYNGSTNLVTFPKDMNDSAVFKTPLSASSITGTTSIKSPIIYGTGNILLTGQTSKIEWEKLDTQMGPIGLKSSKYDKVKPEINSFGITTGGGNNIYITAGANIYGCGNYASGSYARDTCTSSLRK